VIEFALLFASGFLTAAFLAFLVAPAVHRRIVWYTERRLRATMPLSPQEVRAQKDMARAQYAAENAKTEQALASEREKTVALQLRQDDLRRQAGKLAAENSELQTQIDEMNVEAGDLRSRIRRDESFISQLKSSLRASEHVAGEKEGDIEGLRKRLTRVVADVDNLKIDLATRETEIESLKLRVGSLREERDNLRQERNLVTTRAKDAEQRLAQETARSQRLEEKLAHEVAGNADKETIIERRTKEISRLKERLKGTTVEARQAARGSRGPRQGRPADALKATDAEKPPHALPVAAARGADRESVVLPEMPEHSVAARIAVLGDEARNRSTALADLLLNARSTLHDDAMRDEIATIAANMVAMTALDEGGGSPIPAVLAQDAGTPGRSSRVSLAARSTKLLSDES
jgi:hypothetical protein